MLYHSKQEFPFIMHSGLHIVILLVSIAGLLEQSLAQNVTAVPCTASECAASYFDPDAVLSPEKDCYADQESIALSCVGNIGGPTTNQCNNGSWVLPSATCEIFTCAKPEVGDGLNVFPDKSTYDTREVISYSCNQSYAIIGTSYTSCDQQDTWNPSQIPICVARCDVPDVVNSILTTSGPYISGHVSEVMCYVGYNLDPGTSSLLLCEDGGYNSSIPVCYEHCVIPMVSLSTHLSDSIIKHGESLFIECLTGYSFNEYTTFEIMCNNSNITGYITDACYDFTCLRPAVGEALRLNPDLEVYPAWDTVSYTCDQGYKLSDVNSTMCIAQDIWNSSTVPTCIASCNAPVIQNGGIVYTNLYSAEVICNAGYSLAAWENATITCGMNGTWDSIPPQCYANCYVIGINNSDEVNSQPLSLNSSLVITCNPGYSYEQETIFPISCEEDGLISGVIPMFCYADCSQVAAPLYGNVTGGTRHGQSITYTCDDGYSINTTSVTNDTCSGGVWINGGTAPTCYGECNAPAIINGGLSSSGPFLSGDTAEVECNIGFNLEPDISSTLVCRADGTWDSIPQCYAGCNLMGINNSNYTNSQTLAHGSSITITCNRDYSYSQRLNFQISCSNGVINGIVPSQCYADCPLLNIQNGTVTGNSYHGSTDVFTCDSGFVLNGTSLLECNDGTWYPDTTPVCMAQPCFTPTITGDTLMLEPNLSEYPNGTTIEFTCANDFPIDSDLKTSVCLYGVWNPNNPPVCEDTCDPPNIQNGDLDTGGPFVTGSMVEINCYNGYSLANGVSSIIRCVTTAWDVVPQCYKLCNVSGVANSDTTESMMISHGASVTLICNDGYSFDQQATFTATCNNGFLSNSLPICGPSPCSKPTFEDQNLLLSPDLTTMYSNGSTIDYSCKVGFGVIGPYSTVCSFGTWSTTVPTCEVIMCVAPLPADANVRIFPSLSVSNYSHGATIEYSCAGEYALNASGPSDTLCYNGSWIPPATPECEAFAMLVQHLTMSMLTENATTEEIQAIAEIVETASGDVDFVIDEPERVELIINSLESIANVGDSSNEVTESVVNIVNNFLEFEEEVLQNTTSQPGRIIAALEQQISNFHESGEERFIQVLENIGITAIRVNRTTIGSSLDFGNFFPVGDIVSIESPLQENNTRVNDDARDIHANRTATFISVPTSAVENDNADDDSVPISFFIYSNARLFVPFRPLNITNSSESTRREFEKIASQIISAVIENNQFGTTNDNLSSVSRITTKFVTNLSVGQFEEITSRECVFWNYDKETGEGYWANEGCIRLDDEDALTVCSCDHLTSFACLIRVREISPIPGVALVWITFIGSILSIVCLVVCIITFVALPNVRSKKATNIHINLSVSLIGFYVAFLLNGVAIKNNISCAVDSAAIHYFCLATVLWMSMEATNLYMVFAKKTKVARFRQFSYVMGYVVPLLPVILVAFLDRTIIDGKALYCFIQPGIGLYLGFLAMIGITFLFNCFVFVWVTRKALCRPLMVSKMKRHAKRDEIVRRFRHGVMFWFILGLSWVFAFLSTVDTKTVIFQYLFTICIALQGVFLFLMLCVGNPEFRNVIRRPITSYTFTKSTIASSSESESRRSTSMLTSMTKTSSIEITGTLPHDSEL